IARSAAADAVAGAEVHPRWWASAVRGITEAQPGGAVVVRLDDEVSVALAAAKQVAPGAPQPCLVVDVAAQLQRGDGRGWVWAGQRGRRQAGLRRVEWHRPGEGRLGQRWPEARRYRLALG